MTGAPIAHFDTKRDAQTAATGRGLYRQFPSVSVSKPLAVGWVVTVRGSKDREPRYLRTDGTVR